MHVQVHQYYCWRTMLYILWGVKPIIFLMENNADQTCVNAEKRISEYKANLK
jgi:hypothetical protein